MRSSEVTPVHANTVFNKTRIILSASRVVFSMLAVNPAEITQ